MYFWKHVFVKRFRIYERGKTIIINDVKAVQENRSHATKQSHKGDPHEHGKEGVLQKQNLQNSKYWLARSIAMKILELY